MINKITSQIFMCLLGLGISLSVSTLHSLEENGRIPTGTRNSGVIEEREVAGHLSAEESQEEVTNHSNYYTSHPGALHSVSGVSLLGDTIELEDGSIWTVYSGDAHKVLNWLPGDHVVISAYNGWFSSYDFRLTNQSTGSSLLTNLKLGPFYDSALSHWIVAINYDENRVYLDDGSVWNMSYFDYGTVRKWLPDDNVIIGINDSWFSYSNPNILINVNMLNYGAGLATY